MIQDEGAFAIAQALKSNEDVRLASLNLMNNFLTKLGQVIFTLHIHLLKCFQLFEINLKNMQSAITDASDHVYEMNEKELTVVF